MNPYQQQNRESKAWLRRWEEKRRRAFDGGQIDHTKDKSAPWSHPAHYGYLVPLRGAALEAYKGWKIRTGNPESSDAVRWAFEQRPPTVTLNIGKNRTKKGPVSNGLTTDTGLTS